MCPRGGAGEELFGLRVTEYPELLQTKRDLQLCDTLFRLYDEVARVQAGFRSMLWRWERLRDRHCGWAEEVGGG